MNTTPIKTSQPVVSIALIGRNNEPLYLRDFTNNISSSKGTSNAITYNEEDDPFGFMVSSSSSSLGSGNGTAHNHSCLRHQFMVHAALDAFDEQVMMRQASIVEANNNAAGSAGNSNANNNPEIMSDGYMGFIAPMEELRVYGYMTKTGMKMILLLEDGMDFYEYSSSYRRGGGDYGDGKKSRNIGNSSSSRDAETRKLFERIHVLYVEYLMNPFAKLKGKIQSKRFDEKLAASVKLFNDKQL